MNAKIRGFTLASILSLLIAAPGRADDPPAPQKASTAETSPAASPLDLLAFLVGGEWEAKLPAQSDGKQVSILAHFTWVNNRRAIRISNVYALGVKTAPYIEGMYVWHPQKRAIVFWYVDSQGGLYEGTVKPENGGLLHEFQMTDPKGEVTEFSARQTQDGTNAWINEIFLRKDGKLEPEIKVRYEKKN